MANDENDHDGASWSAPFSEGVMDAAWWEQISRGSKHHGRVLRTTTNKTASPAKKHGVVPSSNFHVTKKSPKQKQSRSNPEAIQKQSRSNKEYKQISSFENLNPLIYHQLKEQRLDVMYQDKKQLPVVIVGAGPCGLIAALTLQKERVPFIVLERAEREKLYKDVGSGFDIAPTASDILENRLKVKVRECFVTYAGMHLERMDGTCVREAALKDMGVSDFVWNSASRSNIQRVLLDELLKDVSGKETDILRCGVEVTGYEHGDRNETVTVMISDGTSIVASTLLGCDGINSAVRTQMFKEEEDSLHFCNITCWWGKTHRSEELQSAIDATQPFKSEGSSFLWVLGSHDQPGTLMGGPLGESFVWAFCTKTDSPPTERSKDLTRRGGVTLDDEGKNELETIIAHASDLVNLIVRKTPGSSITKVGLFDREDLEKPYVRGRVALLGDAAHPQSPFMAQGVNMAIADAYVCATRLARLPETALAEYDTEVRRRGVNDVVKKARSYGNMLVSPNRFTCWMVHTLMQWSPISWMARDMFSGDKSNKEFVQALDAQLAKLS